MQDKKRNYKTNVLKTNFFISSLKNLPNNNDFSFIRISIDDELCQNV